ncbi:hypothetical protein EDD17DRAFT_1531333 [Pisolithus thermaeus]|nr:hypothetical protein EDD17DRAFT_1531333 [Pisolithus thermaeus]
MTYTTVWFYAHLHTLLVVVCNGLCCLSLTYVLVQDVASDGHDVVNVLAFPPSLHDSLDCCTRCTVSQLTLDVKSTKHETQKQNIQNAKVQRTKYRRITQGKKSKSKKYQMQKYQVRNAKSMQYQMHKLKVRSAKSTKRETQGALSAKCKITKAQNVNPQWSISDSRCSRS